MKKLIMLLCATAMLFSLTACGGTPAASDPAPSPTPAATPTPAPTETPTVEPTLSAYDQAKQEILDHVNYAYSGITSANLPIYFLLNEGGSFAALFIENTFNKEYIKFIGNATVDSNGIITITDSDNGNTFGFTAETQADGSYFLDCGNLGEGVLKDDEPESVVDSIMAAYKDMTDATDEVIAAVSKVDLLDYVDSAYFGVMEDGSVMYYLESDDGTFAALVIENTDEAQYIKFIGSVSTDQNSGIITVTDRDKGYTFGFIAEANDDGSFLLNCGDLGQAYLEPDAPDSVVGYIASTFEEMEDVTDAIVAALGR